MAYARLLSTRARDVAREAAYVLFTAKMRTTIRRASHSPLRYCVAYNRIMATTAYNEVSGETRWEAWNESAAYVMVLPRVIMRVNHVLLTSHETLFAFIILYYAWAFIALISFITLVMRLRHFHAMSSAAYLYLFQLRVSDIQLIISFAIYI